MVIKMKRVSNRETNHVCVYTYIYRNKFSFAFLGVKLDILTQGQQKVCHFGRKSLVVNWEIAIVFTPGIVLDWQAPCLHPNSTVSTKTFETKNPLDCVHLEMNIIILLLKTVLNTTVIQVLQHEKVKLPSFCRVKSALTSLQFSCQHECSNWLLWFLHSSSKSS